MITEKGGFLKKFLTIDIFFCHGLFIMWVGVGWLEDNDDIRYRKNVLLMSKKEKTLPKISTPPDQHPRSESPIMVVV